MTDYRVNVNGKTYAFNYTITPVDDLYATGTFGASKLQKYVREIAENAVKVYPDKAAELVAGAKALSAYGSLPAIPELKDRYTQMVDAFGLKAYVAVYDSDNRLEGFSVVDAKAIAENGDEADFILASGLSAGPDSNVKVFIWDDSFVPLIQPSVIE
jgi:hypothetical protein